jgi:hypothetical protein
VPGLALLAVLVGAIVLIKDNRNPRAPAIIVPLLVVYLLWSGFVNLMNFPSSARLQFDPLFYSFASGIALLWLLGHKLGNRNRFITFLLALLIMTAVSIVGQASYGGFSEQRIIFIIFMISLSLAVLISFVLSGWRCRHDFNGKRFTLWLAPWMVLSTLAAMTIFMTVMFVYQGVPGRITPVLLQMLVTAVLVGLVLYVINLPFMIMALNSPLYRERFYACLRLKSMPEAAAGSDKSPADEGQCRDEDFPQDSNAGSEMPNS